MPAVRPDRPAARYSGATVADPDLEDDFDDDDFDGDDDFDDGLDDLPTGFVALRTQQLAARVGTGGRPATLTRPSAADRRPASATGGASGAISDAAFEHALTPLLSAVFRSDERTAARLMGQYDALRQARQRGDLSAPKLPPLPPVVAEPERRTAGEDERVSFHEAAHAVAALALGVELHEVTVSQRPGSRNLGHVRHGLANAWQTAVLVLAGPLAEEMFLGGDGRPAGGDARILAGLHLAESARDLAKVEAARILDTRRAGVRALALELRRRRTLTGDEARAVIKAAG